MQTGQEDMKTVPSTQRKHLHCSVTVNQDGEGRGLFILQREESRIGSCHSKMSSFHSATCLSVFLER